jgi:hypothetical protein
MELMPGEGNFYVVRIEAIADPTPPMMTRDDFRKDIRQEINQVLSRMEQMTERELMDQVHRGLTLHLCGPCYNLWIENPTG